jgi:hypothetical protein
MQIGNDWFAWFAGTHGKRRINFLQLLQVGERRYTLNSHALEYWCEEGLPAAPRRHLQRLPTITGTPAREAHLDALGIASVRQRRIATEGALPGGPIETVLPGSGDQQRRGRTSRDPAACPVPGARRAIGAQAHPLDDRQRTDQARVCGEIRDLHAALKADRRAPDPALRPASVAPFDAIFTRRTAYIALKRRHTRERELLRGLERPAPVLHTNGSEGDIRIYVTWRNISGGSRSDLGKDCRDGFAGLKKTCRNPGISFRDDLGDRIDAERTPPFLAWGVQIRPLTSLSAPVSTRAPSAMRSSVAPSVFMSRSSFSASSALLLSPASRSSTNLFESTAFLSVWRMASMSFLACLSVASSMVSLAESPVRRDLRVSELTSRVYASNFSSAKRVISSIRLTRVRFFAIVALLISSSREPR